jgi:dienelactone hydrolase
MVAEHLAGAYGDDTPIGRCLGAQGINALLKRAQDALITKGLITTRVLAEPQDLKSGVLTLTVVPGRVNAIRFAPDSSSRARAWTAVPMKPGDILNLRDIEQGLENLMRLPTAAADIKIEPARTESKSAEGRAAIGWAAPALHASSFSCALERGPETPHHSISWAKPEGETTMSALVNTTATTPRGRLAGLRFALVAALLGLLPFALVHAGEYDCRSDDPHPTISFVQFQSPNLASPAGPPLTIKGKLTLPKRGCGAGQKLPAVLILHGSAGVDARGDFYEAKLNDAGIATLQIDMWEARGVVGATNRPQAPILTYPDAFSALAFLSAHPRIAGERIGVLGLSWGGIITLAAAEQLYTGMFGGGRKFKAHVANYPVCYGYNNTSIPALPPPAQFGTQFLNLTGAPVLIQIGSNDDYDNGTAHCKALAQTVNASNSNVVQVVEYAGAYHAWDRLMVPVNASDPFGNEGSFFRTGQVPTVRIVPNVEQAYDSRARVVRFFRRHL